MEKMCESLKTYGQQVLSTSNGGHCTLSSDCIDMRCESVRTVSQVTNLTATARVHLFPCAKPPAISYKVNSPIIGTILDGTFNESRNISGVVGTTAYDITIDITQRPYGLSVMVSILLLHITYKHYTYMSMHGNKCIHFMGASNQNMKGILIENNI